MMTFWPLLNAGDFRIASNNRGNTLTMGAICTPSVTFTPLGLKSRAAAITLTGNEFLRMPCTPPAPGCADVRLSGKSFTDSFDSGLGTYALTTSNTQGDIGVFGARQKLPSRAALELPPLRTGSGNAVALVIIRAGGV